MISKASRTPQKERLQQEERPEKEDLLHFLEDPAKVDPDLYDRVSYLNLVKQIKEIQQRAGDASAGPFPLPDTRREVPPAQVDPEIQRLWKESLDINDMSIMEQNDMIKLRTMLGIERISPETLSRYNVRGLVDKSDRAAILYPKYRGAATSTRTPDGLKIIHKIDDAMEKESYPLQNETAEPHFCGIFGYHLMTNSERTVVLTTNERDALAVHEATKGAFALALPHGEKVDLSVLPYLEDFEVIYLWFPAFQQDYAKEWGYKLDPARCRLINSTERPIELVRSGKSKDVRRILATEAARLRGKGFVSLTDIREDVKADLIYSSTRQRGLAQWKRFAPLNKYLQGLRPRELTVLTGGTGFGKTTFLCEYSLDLFTQGVRTLFCSFEMPEEKVLKWMLVQFAGVPLYRSEYSGAVDMWLDKFERTKGPLTIMKSNEFREKSINQIAGVSCMHKKFRHSILQNVKDFMRKN
ncbi:hypothetical protein OESDEN_17372 [Oesophagostomum dentatum]|uniref:SF4 helicase domain-containing protein n=1 Tax=Oesophagostomum dentatum TaxID=61180 RepID=A0A0B1SC91_OESDE|nr:hypothetical protein OESDEN_17372 [Oesophagostomum dentatum]